MTISETKDVLGQGPLGKDPRNSMHEDGLHGEQEGRVHRTGNIKRKRIRIPIPHLHKRCRKPLPDLDLNPSLSDRGYGRHLVQVRIAHRFVLTFWAWRSLPVSCILISSSRTIPLLPT